MVCIIRAIVWSEPYTGPQSLLIKMGTRQTNKCLPYITSQNRQRSRVFDLCTKEKVTNAWAGLVYFNLCVCIVFHVSVAQQEGLLF